VQAAPAAYQQTSYTLTGHPQIEKIDSAAKFSKKKINKATSLILLEHWRERNN
jgi:hypothetical protein